MRAPRATRPTLSARIGRLLAIVIVFAAVGPLVGALVLVALVTAIGLQDVPEQSDLHALTLVGFAFALAVSYWLGAAPAAAAGAVIGIRQAFFGRSTWPMALAVGLILGVVMLDRSGELSSAAGADPNALPGSSAVIMLACLIPTMVCWALVRPWYFAAPPSASSAPDPSSIGAGR